MWSLRGSPHLYRRADLGEVQRAVSPSSSADAAKRSAGAGKEPIDHLDALAVIGGQMWDRLAEPAGKGEVSAATATTLPAELVAFCRPCGAVHCHEQLFRMAALHGGVELEPGTHPPLLRRIPGWRRKPGAGDPLAADLRLQVARAYLHFLGPAKPKDLAAFLETTVTEVKRLWPEDVIEVDRAGEAAWLLEDDADAFAAAASADRDATATVRLLNGHDLFLSAKDRHLITEGDAARHKALWPILGRPGVIAADGRPLGTWRPRTKGKRFLVKAEWWVTPTKAQIAAAEEASAAIAATGLTFAGFAES